MKNVVKVHKAMEPAALIVPVPKDTKTELLNKSERLQAFANLWPLFRAGLVWAIDLRITGDKVDVILENVKDIGDRIARSVKDDGPANIIFEDEVVFLRNLGAVWRLIKRALIVAKIFTNKKVDDALDKIIEVGDWMLIEQ